jgi:predicted TIM-barrel fold metal-dependent hydrolase
MSEKLVLWDPHFHIWDVGEDTKTGHDEKELFRANGEAVYTTQDYEADFLPCADAFEHTGGAWLEALSVCQVGMTGPEYTKLCVAEARWAAKELSASDRNYVLIPAASLEEPDIDDVLAELMELPRVRGIRQIVNVDPPWPRNAHLGELLDNPKWREGYAKLSDHKMSFDLQLNAHQFKNYAEFVKDFPDTPVIIGHLGSPLLSDVTEKAEQFRSGIEALAACENTYMKISMLFYTDENWDQCQPVLDSIDFIIDAFGVDRCFFASNFPVDNMKGWTADRMFPAFRKIAAAKFGIEDQRKLFSENAMRAYRA